MTPQDFKSGIHYYKCKFSPIYYYRYNVDTKEVNWIYDDTYYTLKYWSSHATLEVVLITQEEYEDRLKQLLLETL